MQVSKGGTDRMGRGGKVCPQHTLHLSVCVPSPKTWISIAHPPKPPSLSPPLSRAQAPSLDPPLFIAHPHNHLPHPSRGSPSPPLSKAQAPFLPFQPFLGPLPKTTFKGGDLHLPPAQSSSTFSCHPQNHLLAPPRSFFLIPGSPPPLCAPRRRPSVDAAAGDS